MKQLNLSFSSRALKNKKKYMASADKIINCLRLNFFNVSVKRTAVVYIPHSHAVRQTEI